ncbi:hypothetical protein HPB51_003676 [Rhipicephalus microplus]|uniref:TRM5/TYW2-like N-terminal domain-containing protein n=1 Tax=Rhipicephalus microplus TaxID=6941 RepID=A0A9J6DYC0_RHIMP|nr:hypothetical protein HPB51_003676 [Rhipicephalus microplus]
MPLRNTDLRGIDQVSTFNEIDLASQAALSQAGVSVLGERQVSLTYDNWTSEDILRAVIGQPDASGYSLIGHVLHLNLREHLQPYKKLIGQGHCYLKWALLIQAQVMQE